MALCIFLPSYIVTVTWINFVIIAMSTALVAVYAIPIQARDAC